MLILWDLNNIYIYIIYTTIWIYSFELQSLANETPVASAEDIVARTICCRGQYSDRTTNLRLGAPVVPPLGSTVQRLSWWAFWAFAVSVSLNNKSDCTTFGIVHLSSQHCCEFRFEFYPTQHSTLYRIYAIVSMHLL